MYMISMSTVQRLHQNSMPDSVLLLQGNHQNIIQWLKLFQRIRKQTVSTFKIYYKYILVYREYYHI